MTRHPFADGWKIALSLFAGAVMGLVVLGLALAVLFSSCMGRQDQSTDLRALRDTVRITDSVIVVRTETVVKYQRRVDTVRAASDALDSAVIILNDSTAIVQDTGRVELPPLVIANIRALRVTVATQDSLILALYQRDSTQQWRIATRDKLIAELGRQAHRRFSWSMTVGPSCNQNGCDLRVTFGPSYRIR